MKKPGRAGLWVIGLVVVVALLWAAGRLWMERSEPVQKGVELETNQERAVVRESRVEPGEKVLVVTGRWQTQRGSTVRAESEGPVVQWHVESGSLVEEGDLLAEMPLGELQMQRGQAQARYNVARQQVRTLRQLVAGGYEPAERLEAAEADFNSAQAAIAELDQALERTRIYAPVAGRVEILARRQTTLKPGDAVLRVVNHDPVQASVQIPAEHADRVRVGARARLDMQGAGTLEGRVTSVTSPGSNSDDIRAEINISNPAQVSPTDRTVKLRIAL